MLAPQTTARSPSLRIEQSPNQLFADLGAASRGCEQLHRVAVSQFFKGTHDFLKAERDYIRSSAHPANRDTNHSAWPPCLVSSPTNSLGRPRPPGLVWRRCWTTRGPETRSSSLRSIGSADPSPKSLAPSRTSATAESRSAPHGRGGAPPTLQGGCLR